MIGCFNQNGHDCNQSDLDAISFVPFDLLEDAEIHRQVGLEALICDPFNDNEEPKVVEVDTELEELLFFEGLMTGSDYDWDDAPEETPAEWVARRYGDVIELNEKFGYTPKSNIIPFAPSFAGRSRNNTRKRHWSDKRSLRACNPNYDKLRGKAHAK